MRSQVHHVRRLVHVEQLGNRLRVAQVAVGGAQPDPDGAVARRLRLHHRAQRAAQQAAGAGNKHHGALRHGLSWRWLSHGSSSDGRRRGKTSHLRCCSLDSPWPCAFASRMLPAHLRGRRSTPAKTDRLVWRCAAVMLAPGRCSGAQHAQRIRLSATCGRAPALRARRATAAGSADCMRVVLRLAHRQRVPRCARPLSAHGSRPPRACNQTRRRARSCRATTRLSDGKLARMTAT
jgi:hypothetical protein